MNKQMDEFLFLLLSTGPQWVWRAAGPQPGACDTHQPLGTLGTKALPLGLAPLTSLVLTLLYVMQMSRR